MPVWKKDYPGVENLNISVMGCIVNGPGESKHADIGISLPGRGENSAAPVFIDGEKKITLKGDNITNDFKKIFWGWFAQQQQNGKKIVKINAFSISRLNATYPFSVFLVYLLFLEVWVTSNKFCW